MFGGKMKAVTFSYDDGVTQDIRLIELFNKYGIRATFNINYGLLGKGGELIREGVRVTHNKNTPDEAKQIYSRHEIACHTMTHPNLTQVQSDDEVVRQVEDDRLALSELCGYEVVGFAFPGGPPNNDERTARLVRERTGVKYARGFLSSHSTEIPKELIPFSPSVYHHGEFELMEKMTREFLASEPKTPQLLYIWGHAYEFDIHNDWSKMDEFLSMISGHDDIFYGTNKECFFE